MLMFIGMLIGIAFSLLEFAYSYAKKYRNQLLLSIKEFEMEYKQFENDSISSHHHDQSDHGNLFNGIDSDCNLVLPLKQREFLKGIENKLGSECVIISLHGYVFFGTAMDTLNIIKEQLKSQDLRSSFEISAANDEYAEVDQNEFTPESNTDNESKLSASWIFNLFKLPWLRYATTSHVKIEEVQFNTKASISLTSLQEYELLPLSAESKFKRDVKNVSNNSLNGICQDDDSSQYSISMAFEHVTPSKEISSFPHRSPLSSRPLHLSPHVSRRHKSPYSANGKVDKRILVLDFKRVLGVDSTATRSCFLMLVEAMRKSEVHVVFLNISPQIEAIFRAQNVISEFESVNNC